MLAPSLERPVSRPPRAVVLLSGGLDSTTTAAWARDQGFDLVGLSFDYGQRHRRELSSAREVALRLGIQDHRIVTMNLQVLGGSALTDVGLSVPKGEPCEGIPITYVPARNTIFLAVALGLAEVVGAYDIFFGANAVDYSGYPDCRPAFVEAFEALANVATKAAVEGQGRFRVHAPLMSLSKAEIIRQAQALGVDLSCTFSCYDPIHGRACGACDSCRIRRAGFEEAGVSDPSPYVAR
ncbi:MAG: 7-cyano-7-deazaguanine synthase QueC [Myxococcota bacterium]